MRFSKLILIVCILSFVFVINPLQSFAKEENVNTTAVMMIPATFADLADKLSPAVVNISTTQKTTVPQDFPEMPQFPEGSPYQDFFEDFMNRRGGGMPSQPASSLGSGFVIDGEKGYVITNNHVVRNAENVQVTFPNELTVDAEIIGTDEKTDIAVLKIEVTDLKLADVSFGDSDALRVGDWTLAIGNPFGLGGTVTAGILSARARDIDTGPYDDYLQTDASINRGNSGGPLFNMRGEVIGINTAIFSPSGGSVGIGFAIPSALAKPVINQIIKYGRTRRGWLGVRIQSVTDEIAESLGLDGVHGALIASVNDKGPAKAAGLEAGDVILEINSQKVKEMKNLPRIVAEHDINAVVPVKYWRNEAEHIVNVTIGELEKAEEDGLIKLAESKAEGEGTEIESIGFDLKELDDALRKEFQIDRAIEGVLISRVQPNSEASKNNLNVGSIIVEINQQPVTKPDEVADIIKKAADNNRKSVLLLVNENGNARFVAVKLSKE
ncbi:MAG: Do family serine endopeptidase [Alphaproteobacteria bacterium]